MAGFNGSGTFVRTHNWVDDRNNLIKIVADRHDAEDDGFATGLSFVICKDGQTATTARIPFAFGLALSDGTVSAPSMNFGVDANTGIYHIGPDNMGVACAGAKVLDISSTGLAVTGALSLTTPLPVTSGGTGLATIAQYRIPFATAADTIGTSTGFFVVDGGVGVAFQVGKSTLSANMTCSGGNSGANNGTFIQGDNGTVLSWALGNWSALYGGSYSNQTVLHASSDGLAVNIANSSTTALAISSSLVVSNFNVSVAATTVASAYNAASLITAGGLGVAENAVIGSGADARYVKIGGSGSGSNGGSQVTGYNGGTRSWALGNYSAVLGGAYSNQTVLNASSSGFLLNVNVTAVLSASTSAVFVNYPLDISASSAGQIAFPASQNASADANTLDDYEEGTFTAGVSFGGGTTGITYSITSGFYVKVGKVVTVNGNIQMTAKGSSTGQPALTGLPFLSQNTSNNYATLRAMFGSMGSPINNFYLFINANSNTAEVYKVSGNSYAAAAETDFTDTSQIVFQGTYRASA